MPAAPAVACIFDAAMTPSRGYRGPLIRLRLKPGREASVARRHPWLFSGAVASADGDGSRRARRGRRRRAPRRSPAGPTRRTPRSSRGCGPSTAACPTAPFSRSVSPRRAQLRAQVLPPETTGYRAVNSEGDLCPGVLLDVYGDTAVLELTTAGTETWRAELERPVARSSRRGGSSSARVAPRGTGERRPSRGGGQGGEDRAPFLENGLRFLADLGSGQKTGFFLDQRDNRARGCGRWREGAPSSISSPTRAHSRSPLSPEARPGRVDVDSSAARARARAREPPGERHGGRGRPTSSRPTSSTTCAAASRPASGGTPSSAIRRRSRRSVPTSTAPRVATRTSTAWPWRSSRPGGGS